MLCGNGIEENRQTLELMLDAWEFGSECKIGFDKTKLPKDLLKRFYRLLS